MKCMFLYRAAGVVSTDILQVSGLYRSQQQYVYNVHPFSVFIVESVFGSAEASTTDLCSLPPNTDQYTYSSASDPEYSSTVVFKVAKITQIHFNQLSVFVACKHGSFETPDFEALSKHVNGQFWLCERSSPCTPLSKKSRVEI